MPFSHIYLYLRSSFCSRLFFAWNARYLCKALNRPKLTPNDMLSHPANQSCHSNFIRLNKQWKLQTLSYPAQPSLTRAILRTYWVSFLSIALLGFVAESLMGLSFYFMALLIENLSLAERDQGLKNSGLFCVCVVLTLLTRHAYIIRNSLLFIQIRQAITSMMYVKTLNLSIKSLSKISEGRIINAATSDLVVLDIGHSHVMHLFFEPFVALINIYLLVSMAGFTVIYGFFAMLAFVLLQLFTSRCVSCLRARVSNLTDSRLKLLHDTVAGIRSVKAYGWQFSLKERIEAIRHRETSIYLILSFLKSASYTLLRYSSHIAMLIIVCLKTALGEELSAGPIFSVFAALNFLSIFFTMFTGYGITAFAEIKTALQRTTKILLLPQNEVSTPKNNLDFGKQKLLQNNSSANSFQNLALSFKNASQSWKKLDKIDLVRKKRTMRDFDTARSTSRLFTARGPGEQSPSHEPILLDVNLQLKHGELLAVIGTVGSGKTSLLLSLLGEIGRSNGGITLRGASKIAYVSQDPFLIAGTIRDNIIFGQRYVAQKFNYISRLACLEQDYLAFPRGSRTMIGEGGSTLSGGQKARVALARALYSDSDLFLLDDPLSALDPKVAQKVLRQVFCKHLAGKTRVIVTQQLSVLAKASRILYLQQGSAVFLGTFKELQNQNIDLSNTLRTKTGDRRERLSSRQLRYAISKQEEEENVCPINFDSYILRDQEGKRDSITEVGSTQKESKLNGGFSFSTLCTFTSYSCKCFTIPFLLLASLFPALLNLYISEKLKDWVALPRNEQLLAQHRNFMIALVFIFLLSHLFRNLVTGYASVSQTGKLHSLMLKSLLRAKLDFFDHTSVGQIMTRFSKDVAVGDSVIPVLSTWLLDVLFTILSTLVVLCYTIPWSIVPVFVLVTLVLLIRLKAMRISTQAMSLNLQSRSPVIASLAQTLKGFHTIRAYRKKIYFQRRFEGLVDQNSRAFATYHHVSRALGFYLDALSVMLVVLTTFLAFLVTEDPLLWAFLLQLINSLIGTFQFAAKLSADLQNYMTSISRCLQYTKLESEAPLTLNPQNPLNPNKVLPVCFSPRSKQGQICFSNVTMRYQSYRQPALKNFSFQINAGQKVGIVGRTGAGKSSILNALLRLNELSQVGSSGSILIDSVDISLMGLHELRKTLTVIPQTPFLFKGTLRENLDPDAPDSKQSDQRLLKTLYSVGLGEKYLTLKNGLNTMVQGGDSFLSSGEKQLVCLARALLRESKIIVLDQATAKIDIETEAALQRVMKEEFGDCTVLTIAHRMGCVMDNDLVMVMQDGECIERGHPFELLTRRPQDRFITRNSTFAGMVRETGQERNKWLEKARHAYTRRNT